MFVLVPLWVFGVIWVIAWLTRGKGTPPEPPPHGLEIRL